MPLSDTVCRNAKPKEKPYKLADEKGLYLLVKAAGKYWRWDYRYMGKRLTMAIGVYPEVTLKAAREKLAIARTTLAGGTDPMQQKAEVRRQAILAAANTFEAVAMEWLGMKMKTLAEVTYNKKLAALKNDVFPEIGQRAIREITPPEALLMLRKIERRGVAYTATRVREMCGQVFRYGIATGRCESNPMRDLIGTITAPKLKHRPALTTIKEFGQLIREMAEYNDVNEMTKVAAKLAVLTLLRSSELRFGQWDEIDWKAREWRIPAARMKTDKGAQTHHIVPLCDEAIRVLHRLVEMTGGKGLMFPINTAGSGGVISENTVGSMLNRMGYKDRQTLHGFRASARSILSERGWSTNALERQLDHSERDKVVAAYARAEHLPERRRMMDDWGMLVELMESGANVTPLPLAA